MSITLSIRIYAPAGHPCIASFCNLSAVHVVALYLLSAGSHCPGSVVGMALTPAPFARFDLVAVYTPGIGPPPPNPNPVPYDGDFALLAYSSRIGDGGGVALLAPPFLDFVPVDDRLYNPSLNDPLVARCFGPKSPVLLRRRISCAARRPYLSTRLRRNCQKTHARRVGAACSFDSDDDGSCDAGLGRVSQSTPNATANLRNRFDGWDGGCRWR